MEKIGIYGGTFNPIHNGHLHLARCFVQRLGLDRVILIPTNVPPHKAAKDLVNAQDRLKMCALAAQIEGFQVSDVEIARQGPSYTRDTLLVMAERFPDSELYLITGEDMFLTVESWRDPGLIFQLAVLCAAPRSSGGIGALSKHAARLRQFGARTVVEDIEYLPISSTMIRDAVKSGQSITGLVPASVEEYIREHQLYQGGTTS